MKQKKVAKKQPAPTPTMIEEIMKKELSRIVAREMRTAVPIVIKEKIDMLTTSAISEKVSELLDSAIDALLSDKKFKKSLNNTIKTMLIKSIPKIDLGSFMNTHDLEERLKNRVYHIIEDVDFCDLTDDLISKLQASIRKMVIKVG